MFPRPIQQSSPGIQWLYTIALPVVLLIWLFPLLGVALTSVRPAPIVPTCTMRPPTRTAAMFLLT